MQLRLAFLGAVIAAMALAACTSGSNTAISPPAGSGTVSSAATVTLSSGATLQAVPAANGIAGTLTYAGGSGSVTAATSATAPAGTIAVNPASLIRTASSATSPTVFYLTLSSTTGATLTGFPGVALTLTSAPVGTYNEAQYNGKTWVNVAVGTANGSGTVVEFPAGTSAVTIPANGSVSLAFYQGTYPEPTPTATPVNVLADGDFHVTTVVPDTGTPAPVSTGAWTQCSITALSKSAPAGTAPIHPFSTYTPNPLSTPGAVILAGGTSVAIGSATPVPTQSTVPTYQGAANAAVFGGLFNTYNQGDYYYNGLCQTVTIPKSATMSAQVFANGNEAAAYVDFDLILLDTSGGYLTTLYDEPTQTTGVGVTATSSGDTAYRPVTVAASSLTPYVGQQVELFVGMWTKAGSSSNSTKYSGYYFVDNLQLLGFP